MTENLIKNYCEYLTFRSFYSGFPLEKVETPYAQNLEDARNFLSDILSKTQNPALLLSGGMDSAVLVPFVPKNTTAYTIFHEGLDYSEVAIAKQYCDKFSIKHVAISIDPEESLNVVNDLILNKKMPLSPAEPMFHLAAKRAFLDGHSEVITGGGADAKFGGFTRFRRPITSTKYQRKLQERYHKPRDILKKSVKLNYLFDQYAIPMLKERSLEYYLRTLSPRKRDRCIIDSKTFMREISVERFAYDNAISSAGCKHIAPFFNFLFDFDEGLKMQKPKYFIQDLYESIYGCEPPKKLGLQKPTFLLSDYSPCNMALFRENIDTSEMSYPRKFLLFCLERYEELRMKGMI